VQEWKDGEDIIKQGQNGDSLFLLKEGSVVVSRKSNPRDKAEKPTILARLPKNICFGEIALLTEEPRSATITAVGICVTVQMKKSAFDEILRASNEKSAKARMKVGSAVLDSVPLFKSLSKGIKGQVLGLMMPVSYPVGSYICRQGGLGNSFFIIVEGAVRCTVGNEDGEEREVARLGPGSYFGEAALLDPSSIRSANIISTEATSCLSLSRDGFTGVMREIKAAEIKANQEMFSNQKRGKRGAGVKGSAPRLVTGSDPKTMTKTAAMNSIVPRIARFMTEALWCSLYSKLFRDASLHPTKMEEYGKCLWKVLHLEPPRAEAVQAIRREFLNAVRIPSEKRTEQEHAFVCGVLRQNNKLKSQLCSDFHAFQFTELSKSMTFKTFQPLESIMEVGTEGTCMYLIIRGAVRVWKGTQRSNLVHDEDLVSGDIFGEQAMDGEHKRSSSARAMTEVDVAIIEEKHFFYAQNRGLQKQTTNEKFLFLRGLQLFRKTDDSILNSIAHVMQQKVISKNVCLLKPGVINDELVFVHQGQAAVVAPMYPGIEDADMHRESVPFARINDKEFYGESGFISNKAIMPHDKMRETHYVVSATVMNLLVLRPQFYHLLGSGILNSVKASFKSKITFRNQRLHELEQERREVHKCQVAMRKMGVVRAARADLDLLNETTLSEAEAGSTGTRTTNSNTKTRPESAPRRCMSPPTYSSGGSIMNISDNASLGAYTATSRPSTGGLGSVATNANGVSLYKSTKPITTTNFDLEDIPLLLDKHFDPFMVLEAAHGDRDQKAKRFVFRQLNRPRIVRSRGRDARESCERGFLTQAIESAGAMYIQAGTGHIGPDVARARLEAQRAMSASASRQGASGTRGDSARSSVVSRGSAVKGLFGGLEIDDMTALTIQTGLPRIIQDSKQSLENDLFGLKSNSPDRPKSSPGNVSYGQGGGRDLASVASFQTNQTGNQSRPGSSGGSLIGSSRFPPNASYGATVAAARGRPDRGQARRDRSNSPLSRSRSRSPPRRPGTSG